MKRSFLSTLALLVVCGATFAQEAKPDRRVTNQDRQVMNDRDRETLHEGSDPFKIVGLEQGDNEFRSRTPALAATDAKVAYVDTEELRHRQIAMFSGGSVFRRAPHAAPPPFGGSGGAPHQEHPGEEIEPSTVETAPASARGEDVWIILGSAIGVGVVAFALKKLVL